MGKLTDWFKNIFRGSQSDVSPGRPPAPAKSVSDVEREIDFTVGSNILGCKNLLKYNSRLDYWQSVIKAICFAESGFNPLERYYEKTMGYCSLGLMQLSYEDCRFYNYDEYLLDKTKEDLFNVEKNIQFGMFILDKLVGKQGRFIFNKGNYWAVLQPKNKRHQVFLDNLNKYLSVK